MYIYIPMYIYTRHLVAKISHEVVLFAIFELRPNLPTETDIQGSFLDGYCSTIQDLLDWFEVDLGFTELLLIQIDFQTSQLKQIFRALLRMY